LIPLLAAAVLRPVLYGFCPHAQSSILLAAGFDVKQPSAIGTTDHAGKLRLLLCGPILVALFSFAVYLSNGRTDRSGDTVPASLIPVTVLLSGTTMLDAFAEEEHRRFANPYWLKVTPHGTASVYPLATGILSIPIYAPSVLLQQWREPPLSIDEWRDFAVGPLQKVAASIFAAAAVGVFWSICVALGFRPGLALALTILYAFGSENFAISSQGLYQHGPVSLALLCAIRAFFALQSHPKTAALLIGLSLALAVAIRINNLLLAAPIGIAVLFQQPRLWQFLLIAPSFVAAALFGYNETVFGSMLGGGEREIGKFAFANIPSGLLGSFFSPARGLFLYFPAALVALVVICRHAAALHRDPLWPALGLGILLMTLLNVSYNVWYGGHTFGPRYFTEVQPLILILLGAAWQTSGLRSGIAALLLAPVIAYSVSIQSMGTFNDATMTWNASPTNVDRDRSRLWDWTDNPIFRGLRANRHSLN
jgi:hypothetical protein